MLVNASVGYRGSLVVVAVPKGSVWNLSISDVPVNPINGALGVWGILGQSLRALSRPVVGRERSSRECLGADTFRCREPAFDRRLRGAK